MDINRRQLYNMYHVKLIKTTSQDKPNIFYNDFDRI